MAAITVHPSDDRIVAVAAKDGLYVSTDSGNHFRHAATGSQGHSVAFDLDGKHLWYGSYHGQARLVRLTLSGMTTPQPVALPTMRDDAVAYVAQNPVHPTKFAIATFRRGLLRVY